MIRSGFGDLAQTLQTRHQTATLKLAAQQLGTEMATGRAADTAAALRGDLVALAAIETALARAAGHRTATAEAALFAEGVQAALDRLNDGAAAVAPLLLASGSASATSMVGPAARESAAGLETAVATLNTRLGDRSLFAGIATTGPALAPAGVILDAVATAAAAETTAAGVEAAVAAWFDDPAGFAAVAYLGGPPRPPLALSPEDRASLPVTALEPALRDTLAALAIGALTDRGTPALPDGERAALAQRAGERLLTGQSARTELQAAVGTQEARIASAARRNAAETAALDLARASLLGVDPADTATRLQATQTQIETLYAVTVRLSRLSLADFLR